MQGHRLSVLPALDDQCRVILHTIYLSTLPHLVLSVLGDGAPTTSLEDRSAI